MVFFFLFFVLRVVGGFFGVQGFGAFGFGALGIWALGHPETAPPSRFRV